MRLVDGIGVVMAELVYYFADSVVVVGGECVTYNVLESAEMYGQRSLRVLCFSMTRSRRIMCRQNWG